MKIPYTF